MIRILLVDDQNLIQEGIKALLDQHTELKVIGTVKDGRNAVKLVNLLHPDIVLLDIEMPGMDGITVTKHISRIAPETKVIILTSYEDKKYVTQSLLAGARGYILKSSLMKDLKQAILAVDNGYCQLESRLLDKVFNSHNVKLKKTPTSTTSDSEEKQQEKHITEHSSPENKAKPLNKEHDFVNKNSEQLLSNYKDVRTDSKDNEFMVSPNPLAISSPVHSVLIKSEIQPVGSFDTLLTLPQNQPTQIISAETTNTLFSLPQNQFTQKSVETSDPTPTQKSVETSDPSSQTQSTQIISVETTNTGATPSQTQSTQTQSRETSDPSPTQNQSTEIISVETTNTEATPSQTQSKETSAPSPTQNQPIEIISVETTNTEATPSQTQSKETSAPSPTQNQSTQIISVETTNTEATPSQTQSTQTQSKETSDPSPTQNQPIEIISVETTNTGATPSQTQSTQTQPIETSDPSPTQNQPIEIISVETTNTEATPSQTQSRETSNTPSQTQSKETSDPSPTQNQQENIQNSKVPLLPVVNRMALLMASENSSSPEDNVEKREKNKLVTKTSAFKNYFQKLVSKKNISRYKTNISIITFKYRLIFNQYRAKAIQYTKLKTSQYSTKNGQQKIKLERYRSKLLLLVRYWHEKKIFSNIGLMILGAVIFFLIHSIFN